jgi:RNA polymerase sigma-70 factor (ECF subfamily)
MHDRDAETANSVDVALLRRIARGEEEAFVELYRRRQPDIYRFAFALSKSRAIAQDVTQDVFLGILQSVERFDAAKGSVRGWLLGCTRHAVLDRMRRDRRSTADEPPTEECSPCDGEDSVLKEQRLQRLHAAIVDLPIEYREAIVLCELVELSYEQAAAVLDRPVGTIRSRLHRGKALLATRLGDLAPTTRASTEIPSAQPEQPGPLLKTSEVCS